MMHPFHRKIGNHSKLNENSPDQGMSFHPFVRSQGKLHMENLSTISYDKMKSNLEPIIMQETLEHVLLELSLLKNKN
ncbi:hypothetical protein LZQ00_06675 [Sphingobacterium sp. SRCM116780]|uniref:hypothetical protein n=1 Tax=Sphingobacterium sp. SRCM116780 TaxID=2907623 RepID=UPI001F4872EC|nr:hypothetical protein [Sphingobacterium sp. SRCM116780]UIR57497.1 hypothetical protein LZQ00_06675 [Sphingobacterium sp. SRCM116780]